MVHRITLFCLALIVCLFVIGAGAEDQPAKKVMSYLAVMDLECDESITAKQCSTLTDILLDEIVKSQKYTVIDRANRDKILSEVGFQQTGCVEGGCVVEAGRILGVGKIVVGKISKLGGTYVVSLQLLNVETATVETSTRERCDDCEISALIDTVAHAARKLMGLSPSAGGPTGLAVMDTGEMVLVPEGEFIMGSKNGTEDEKPVHRVYLDEFYIDKYEVTNEQYTQCVEAGLCSPNGKYEGFTGPMQPVVGVGWNQASTYCSWAGKRLPTEAEWEKAARGTDGRSYPWGEGIDCSKANYMDCKLEITKPVGSYPLGASPYGAMDMAGNVWEWCADRYGEKYYRKSPSRNPKGPSSGEYRVIRGGSFDYHPMNLRVSYRNWKHSEFTGNEYGGFRCAKNP